MRFVFWAGALLISFSVAFENRAQGALADWVGQPLPQTKVLPKMSVTIVERKINGVDFGIGFRGKAIGTEPGGWFYWHAEILDRAGKQWSGAEYGLPSFSNWPFERGIFKVRAQGKELLSGGMFLIPRANDVHLLKNNARAAELGLEKAWLLGPGEFKVSFNQVELLWREATNETLSATPAGKVWELQVASLKPAVLLIYTNGGGIAGFSGRMRERTNARNQGRIFEGSHRLMATNANNPSELACLVPISPKTFEYQVEAEVIALHPECEFFVARLIE